MLKGIDRFRKAVDEAEKAQSDTSNRIKYLYLGDKDIATLRFLTDGDDLVSAFIHEVEELTQTGKKFHRKYCTVEDTGSCQYCDAGVKKGLVVFMWAWVYSVVHPVQNPKLEKDMNATRWTIVKVKGATMYKEDINALRVFAAKPGKDRAIHKSIDNYFTEYKTLCDRDYKWERSGASLNTSYSLMPKDPSKLSKEIFETQKNLLDLGRVATGELLSYDQKLDDVADTATTSDDF